MHRSCFLYLSLLHWSPVSPSTFDGNKVSAARCFGLLFSTGNALRSIQKHLVWFQLIKFVDQQEINRVKTGLFLHHTLLCFSESSARNTNVFNRL